MQIMFSLFFILLVGCEQGQKQPIQPKKEAPQKQEADPCGKEFAKFRKHVAAYSKSAGKAAKGDNQALTKTQGMFQKLQRSQWKVAELQKNGKLNKDCEKQFSKLQASMGQAVVNVTNAPPPSQEAPAKKGDKDGKKDGKKLSCAEKCKAMKAGPMSKLMCQNKCDKEKK